MPLQIGIEAGKFGVFGPKIDGVRALVAIGLAVTLAYLALKGNELALGALIPLAREAIEMYVKGQNGGSKTDEKIT